MPPLPAFSDKLLQPRSKPDDPLTDDQIGNFDKYYRKRTKVESVNVKSNKPVIRLATQRKDVAQILQNKITTHEELVRFVKQRGKNMRTLQVRFCLELLDKLGVDDDPELLETFVEVLLTAKNISFVDNKYFLKFATSLEPQNEQLLEKLAASYLTALSSSQTEQLDCSLIRELPESVLALLRKLIIRLSKRSLDTGVDMLCFLAEGLSEEEAKNYDKWLAEGYTNLSVLQRTKALQAFARAGKKGIFVELMKTHMFESLPQAQRISEVIGVAAQLTKLNELDEAAFQQFQHNLTPFLQRRQFTQTDLGIIIQLAHHNCSGSREFWELLRQIYTDNQYSEMFAILGGYDRNRLADSDLFVGMVAQDAKMEALQLHNQNEFLKLMLVYHRNISRMDESHPHKQVIVEKVKTKLLEVYKSRPFKTFTMLFLWLLESDPNKKQEYLKLIYSRADEQELIDIMADPTVHNPTSEAIKQRFDYSDEDPARCALEIFIRKRKTEFDRKK